MSEVKMPTPTWARDMHGEAEVFTRDDMEAYADAKVREALGEAARAIEDHQRKGREWIPSSLWNTLSREAAARIRALAPGAQEGA